MNNLTSRAITWQSAFMPIGPIRLISPIVRDAGGRP